MDDVRILMMQLAAKGYSCSQIIIQLALDARGEANPSLIRAMAGPAYGCGAGHATCGALTGGACLLALYAAKGSDTETESERFACMLEELSDWFHQQVGSQYGGIVCETITGEDGPAAARQRCGAIVADIFTKAMEILVANGFDPYAAD
ncbi:DVU_1555 family C-GCAxxG-C-C protein [uncultured Desulfosarcina sp.]|uniref:DVU_1555 family C-GCAxxG-C-C protein n=1 Tax=uncultured Desulfosarcina sp. TaxID=218289 RepID=UPI0029C86494|nr:DV_1555 family C-GCAxxG-C-C protein [uncultured Desulfosarcina sp.]